jgi:DNA-binding protein H-NS
VQQAVLDELVAAFQAAKKQRISKLEKELASLLNGTGHSLTQRNTARKTIPETLKRSSRKGLKIPPKYRDTAGNTWAGRGVHPKWMTEYLKKRGNKIEDLLIKN